MTRYVSFGVLLGVIVLLCIVFYKVMASFLLPLFLAAVLVVVFRPVHNWVMDKCNYRKSLSCAITTTIICLAVIVPIGLVGLIAFGEARQLLKGLTSGGLEQNIKQVRKSLKLEIPAAGELHKVEETVQRLSLLDSETQITDVATQFYRINYAADQFELALNIPNLNENSESKPDPEITPSQLVHWQNFRKVLVASDKLREQYLALSEKKSEGSNSENQKNEDFDDFPDEQPDPNGPDPDSADAKPKKTDDAKAVVEKEEATKKLFSKYKDSVEAIPEFYRDFKTQLLGGQINVYLKELANPTPEEFEKYNTTLIDWIKTNFLSLGGKATQFLFTFLFDAAIMMIAVYFFLYDGARMIESLKFLSPLDDRHEQELIEEFDNVSRAVVVATLAAALAQGLLAGVGYYFAGVQAVILLTMLTAILALVPFIGAAAIWVPACLYLYLIEDRVVPAVMLAIWGGAVVSTVDNLVKPLILHGKSNIHPLLALLSVLGGVTALGPIGILVGPMIVVFLQTLLRILQRELSELDSVNDPEVDDDLDSTIADGVERTEVIKNENSVNHEAQPDEPTKREDESEEKPNSGE